MFRKQIIKRLGTLNTISDAERWSRIIYYDNCGVFYRIAMCCFNKDRFLDIILYLFGEPYTFYADRYLQNNPDKAHLFYTLLKNKDQTIRNGAIFLLGCIGGKEIVSYIEPMAANPKDPAHVTAMIALFKVDSKQGLLLVSQLMFKETSFIQKSFYKSLISTFKGNVSKSMGKKSSLHKICIDDHEREKRE